MIMILIQFISGGSPLFGAVEEMMKIDYLLGWHTD